MDVEVLMKMLEEKEAALQQMLVQFNLQLGHIKGEISMINEMLAAYQEEEALPSEDETGE
jgi:hypothetical protein